MQSDLHKFLSTLLPSLHPFNRPLHAPPPPPSSPSFFTRAHASQTVNYLPFDNPPVRHRAILYTPSLIFHDNNFGFPLLFSSNPFLFHFYPFSLSSLVDKIRSFAAWNRRWTREKKKIKEGRKEAFSSWKKRWSRLVRDFGRGARMEAVFQEVRTGEIGVSSIAGYVSWPRPISRTRCTRHKSLINHRERMGACNYGLINRLPVLMPCSFLFPLLLSCVGQFNPSVSISVYLFKSFFREFFSTSLLNSRLH